MNIKNVVRYVSQFESHLSLLPGNAAYSELAPPKSYIDVRDFESPSHLASHLKYLMDHPKEYDSYLEWSKRYRVSNNSLVSKCKSCEISFLVFIQFSIANIHHESG